MFRLIKILMCFTKHLDRKKTNLRREVIKLELLGLLVEMASNAKYFFLLSEDISLPLKIKMYK